MGYSTTAVQQALTLMMNVRFILSQPKKEDEKMSLTAEEFDKAIEINEEIEKIKRCIRKLEHYNTPYFSMTNTKVERFEIPRELEGEIVSRIYEWYKNRLKQAEDELSKLVTRE